MNGPYTEEQIEQRVERKMDTLDYCLLLGEISAMDYDLAVKQLDAWAERQYQNIKVGS